MARPLRDRLLYDLDQIRTELVDTVSSISSSDLGFAPAEGMKSYLAQLKEIGGMEVESIRMITTGAPPPWADAEAAVAGATTRDLLDSLAKIREETTGWLAGATDEDLKNPIPLPEDWWQYFDDKEIEREELLRWIARHEYYHLGQIIAYRWIQGENPYKKRQPDG